MRERFDELAKLIEDQTKELKILNARGPYRKTHASS